MAFLVCTCIEPISSFLGIIPLRIAMIIMAAILIVCGAYTYFESQVFFKDEQLFGVINNVIYAAIEGAVALMVLLDFFIKKRFYTTLLYIVTLALTGITLVYNIIKVSLINDKVNSYNVEHKFIQFMFIIRVGAEFCIQMGVCYMCYCYKKSLWFILAEF